MPVAALAATVSVRVEDPDPGAAMLAGLKAAVTPAGMPAAVNAIALSKPPEIEAVIRDVPFAPCCTVTVAGSAPKVNDGLVVKVKHCVRSPVAEFPSRGGKGAPLVELFVSGVLLSNV